MSWLQQLLLLSVSFSAAAAFAPLYVSQGAPSQFSPGCFRASRSRHQPLCAEKAQWNAGEDEDQAPALKEDWRDFRARLVSQEVPPYTRAGKSNAKVEEAVEDGVEAGTVDHQRRSDRPLMGSSWAHESPVEPGCILIARPDYFGSSQHYFNQAVICLVEHNEQGTAGFVLNRPTPYKIGSVTDKLPGFEESPLYLGGDVGEGVQVLHGVRTMSGAKEIVDGLMMGVDPWQAKELVDSGECSTHDFRFFYKYAGWAPGQLHDEIERGVWYSAACSRDLILQQCLQLPKPLWREVLELMGGRYSLISKATYGEL